MAIISSVDVGEGIVDVVVNHDPTSVATDVLKGSRITEQSTGFIFIKTDDGATTNVKKILSQAGEIFAGANETVLTDVENLKVSLAETTNPTTTDDINAGYSVGSRWINVSTDAEFVCLDNTASAAVWTETTSAGGGAHASTHSNAGGDEITVENLGTVSTDVSAALRPDGAGGLAFSDVAHSDLTGIGADDHHNQSHILATNVALGADHTISGAAAGQVLRASSATAANFQALDHADLGNVGANDHHRPAMVLMGTEVSTQSGSFSEIMRFKLDFSLVFPNNFVFQIHSFVTGGTAQGTYRLFNVTDVSTLVTRLNASGDGTPTIFESGTVTSPVGEKEYAL